MSPLQHLFTGDASYYFLLFTLQYLKCILFAIDAGYFLLLTWQ